MPFYNRAVGSIEVKPGDSKTIFAASGRAVRGLREHLLRRRGRPDPGRGALRPLPLAGQRPELGRSSTRARAALCTGVHAGSPSRSARRRAHRAAPAASTSIRSTPTRSTSSIFGRGIWRSKANGNPGTFEQIMAPVTPIFATAAGGAERAEVHIVKLPSGETRMYVGVGGGGVAAIFRRNNAVRKPSRRDGGGELDHSVLVDDRHAGVHKLQLLRPVLVRQLRVRACPALPELGCE